MLRLEFPRTIEFPPSKRQYQVNDFLTFTPAWPVQLGIAPGHTYQVVWRQDVPYDLHYIIAPDDWKDVDISDATSAASTSTAQQNLYPYQSSTTIYQILFGFKPGNYMVHLYMPNDQFILSLEYTGMYPSDNNMTNPIRKYIGALKPEDSPHYDPRLSLITVYNMLPFYLRYLVDDGDYEKCITNMIINHMKLTDVTGSATPEQKSRNIIRYVTEIAFRNSQGVS
jgi:hypothetical protein